MLVASRDYRSRGCVFSDDPHQAGHYRVNTVGLPNVRVSTESTQPVDDGVFDYLPSSPEEYAAVEKKLIRRIERTLMPVMMSIIVLK
jgi:hypothetical protein